MSKEGGVLAGLGLIATVVTVAVAGASDRPSNAQLNRDTLDALNGRSNATTSETVMTLEWQGSSALVQCRKGNPNGLLTSKDPDGIPSMGFACDTDQSTKGLTAKVNGEPFQTSGDTINPYETLNER